MNFDLADLTALDLLDAELIGCVGADFGDNMVAAFQATKAPAPPAAEGSSPLSAAYDAARGFFFPKPEAKPDYGDNMVAAFQAQAQAAAPAAASPLPGAIAAGNRDESVLTDLEFSARHPERGGQKIGPGDTALAKEWLRIREDVVRPALLRAAPARPATAALVVPSPAVAAAPPPGSNAAVAEQVAADMKRNQQIALGLGALALLGLGTAIITR